MKLVCIFIFTCIAMASSKQPNLCHFQNLPYTSTREKMTDFKALPKDHPLIGKSTPEMILYYNYPVETHHVTTKDGYYLQIHRIPFGSEGTSPGEIRKPVIIQHGMLSSSVDWVVNGPEKALGFQLADAGYDVWMTNARGNTYSRDHVEFNPKGSKFWNFTWDEMGELDIPAVIDYILLRTGFDKLHYVGHSMGTTMFFVTMDKNPKYNKKVEAMFALGPVTTVDNMKSPIRILAPFADFIGWFLGLIGYDEFLPSTWFMEWFAETFCDDDDFTQTLCTSVIFVICGYNPKQLNETMLPVYLSGTPAGTSTKTMVHYMQGVNSAKFQDYDYKSRKNQEIYGQTAPPEYDVAKTTVPVYIFWGANDWLASETDTMELAEQIPNLALLHKVEDNQWAHLDHMWGINATEYVYNYIIREMYEIDGKKFYKSTYKRFINS